MQKCKVPSCGIKGKLWTCRLCRKPVCAQHSRHKTLSKDGNHEAVCGSCILRRQYEAL